MSEMRRVLNMDYHENAEHFVEMGEKMTRFIYQLSHPWSQFLSHYNSMNSTRRKVEKEFEENYGIGEEREPLIPYADSRDSLYQPPEMKEENEEKEEVTEEKPAENGEAKPEEESKEEENEKKDEE